MDSEALKQGLALLAAGMAVLFVFMGAMIVIVHYFQIVARKLGGKKG